MELQFAVVGPNLLGSTIKHKTDDENSMNTEKKRPVGGQNIINS